jgi:glycosyltransferase involved in cell wall biosynthesis
MAANIEATLPAELYEAESNVLDTYPDVVIQNALPHYFSRQPDCWNIGIAYFESAKWTQINWHSYCNLMDEIWVSSKAEENILRKSGVKTRISIVPMPIDTSWLSKDAAPLDIPNIDDSYVFYYIGEMIHRKNIEGLIIAFHREFTKNEPVKLVIKTTKLLHSSEELSVVMQQQISDIKSKMRLYQNEDLYASEFLITDFLNQQELAGLHKLGDCLVLPSRGESLSRPVMEAMYMGNDVIVTNDTGMADLVGDCGFLVESHETPVYVPDPPLANLYTSWETWREPSIIDLQRQMRAAYESSDEARTARREKAQHRLDSFSCDSIATLINQHLSIIDGRVDGLPLV